jgi:hypothetical protein
MGGDWLVRVRSVGQWVRWLVVGIWEMGETTWSSVAQWCKRSLGDGCHVGVRAQGGPAVLADEPGLRRQI